MGSSSSRRLRRREQLEEIEVRNAQWKLRFYRWGGGVLLIALSVQVAEVVLALIEHRVPHVVVDLRAPP